MCDMTHSWLKLDRTDLAVYKFVFHHKQARRGSLLRDTYKLHTYTDIKKYKGVD